MDRWHERFDSVCLSEDGGGGFGEGNWERICFEALLVCSDDTEMECSIPFRFKVSPLQEIVL